MFQYINSFSEQLNEKIAELNCKATKNTVQTNEVFHLPITYLEQNKLYNLSPTVSNDLELAVSTTKPIYDILFKPKHKFAYDMIPEWNKYYTTDVDFLNNTKNVIHKMKIYREQIQALQYQVNCDKIQEIWNETKQNSGFLAKYSYIEWDFLKQFNQSSSFLQALSIANIASPVMSLMIPFFFLLFPFIILKIQNVPITVDIYYDVLKSIAQNHFIGKALSNLKDISPEKLVYLIMTLGLYVLQIYQNIVQCNRFYNNMNVVNGYLCEMRHYTKYSIHSMRTFIQLNQNESCYRGFIQDVEKQCVVLEGMQNELKNIEAFGNTMSKLGELGYLLKCFYELHCNEEYERALSFSFGFEGYVNNLLGVFENLETNVISFANFDTNTNCDIVNQYYPLLIEENPVKNTCNFKKNMIISSPNAGGKTTMIKTTTINIIFSQQLGCGFYESCLLNPYTHIHSYLNIPDTSGRDSLFQAESRRCKEIIDIINNYKSENYRHFCIFDELYSGTNPIEATKSAYAFLLYLSKFNNVNFILTTHYIAICKRLKKSERIQNYKMNVENLPDGGIKYTYKMKKGISKIQGALKILQQMEYPDEIIETIKNYNSCKNA